MIVNKELDVNDLKENATFIRNIIKISMDNIDESKLLIRNKHIEIWKLYDVCLQIMQPELVVKKENIDFLNSYILNQYHKYFKLDNTLRKTVYKKTENE